MVKLYTDRRMLDHAPPKGHPERPERLATCLRHLERTGLDKACEPGAVREVTDAELLRVHSAGYLRELAEVPGHALCQVEGDTWMSPGSALAARLAAGAAVEAVDWVMGEGQRRAFCVVRPPGHHARPGEPMGFCLFGNIAVAAAHAREQHGLDRLLVVDFDVHHGNGTQEMFYQDGRVAFLSIHRYPFYPGSGAADETGTGRGLGMIKNVPVHYGTSRPGFLAAFRNGLADLAERVKPQLVLVSAGFDAHVEDPVGDLGLEVEDFEAITKEIVAMAETFAEGRIVSSLEGGYNVPILADCVTTHLIALGARPPAG